MNSKLLFSEIKMTVFKKAVLAFLFISYFAAARANSYYVDAANGNDSNSGKDISSPWKSLSKVKSVSYHAGDKILFKKGEKWNGQLDFSSSGTSSNPIVIGAYGTGERPIITVNSAYSGTWTLYSGNIWKIADIDCQPWRVRVEGEEKLQAISLKEIDGVQYFWYIDTDDAPWDVTDADIYLYSETDPNTLLIELNTVRYAFGLSGVHDVVVRDIDIQGGNDGCFSINSGSYNIHLINDKIGNYARFGVTMNHCHDIIIDSCFVDANFEFQYDKSSLRGPGDGVTSWGSLEKLELKNSTIRTWGHDCIYWHEGNKNGNTQNNNVHDCLIEGVNSYCRAFETGGYAKNNEFYNNIVRHMTTRSQVGGTNNHFHHNIFYDITNTPVKSYADGQAFAFQNFEEPEDGGNIIEFNVFADIDEQALLYVKNSDDGIIKNNIFRNNIIYNAGRNTKNYNDKGVAVKIINSSGVEGQTVVNNCIYSPNTDKVIHYRGKVLSVDEFNDKDGNNGDEIFENISGDPQFVNMGKFDFRLQNTSPCIDAGAESSVDVDFDGNPIPYGDYPDIGAFEYSGSTGMIDYKNIPHPDHFDIIDGYPNPFNPETNIRFFIPRRGYIVFSIYNGAGQKIKTLHNGDFAKGVHTIKWNGTNNTGEDVSSGMYFAQLQFERGCKTLKLLLLK